MGAAIALQRQRPLINPYHLHCPKGAGDHTAFTADAALLLYPPDPRLTLNGLHGADAGAGGLFTLMAGHRRGERRPLHHPNARSKGRWADRRA